MALTRVTSATSLETVSNTAHSFSHSLAVGSDLLVGFVIGERGGDTTEPLLSSLTYGGNASNAVTEAFVLEGVGSVKIFAQVWLAADLPSPGSNTLSVSLSPGYGTGTAGFAVCLIEYAGAKQSVPTNFITPTTTANTTSISGDLGTIGANAHVAAAAVNNNSLREWTSFSTGTLLDDFGFADTRGGLGGGTTGGTISFSTTAENFGRAAMVALEIEEAVAASVTLPGALMMVGI